MPGSSRHSAAWDRCVERVGEKGNVDSPYAVCTASVGKGGVGSGKPNAGAQGTPHHQAKPAPMRLSTVRSGGGAGHTPKAIAPHTAATRPGGGVGPRR